MQFEIVSPHEMNLEAGKISLKSPIGAALMGKKVGETVEVQVPSGTLRLKIESIKFD
jgi:transcription elongation factor GreA